MLKLAAKMICPPAVWLALRRLYHSQRRTPKDVPAPSGRVLRTIDELDLELLRVLEAGKISDDALRRSFDFRFDPGELNLPTDPNSKAYRQAQMALYAHISGRTTYDPCINEHTPIVASHITEPFPYATKSYSTVSDQLSCVGFTIRAMGLSSGGSILEFGPGWGLSTLELMQMGYDVTAVDVNQQFIDLIAERARRLDQKVSLACSEMLEYRSVRRFDRVLFYECFHHVSDHLRMLKNLEALVAPDGVVIFAGEPILDDFYCPWGIRLDGQSVWSIRQFGWLELGFRTDYFRDTLERHGWTMTIHQSLDVPWFRVYVARRTGRTSILTRSPHFA